MKGKEHFNKSMGVVSGWIGVEVGVSVWEGAPWTTHMHACMNMHAHIHTHTHMHVKHDKHGCLHRGGHLQFLYMCMHACTYMCTCVGHPHAPDAPRHPSIYLPHPQQPQGVQKHQNSWTDQDNSILFEDSLPLNTPKLI